MSRKFLIASAGLLAALSAQADVSVTGPSFTYTQNFDSLPATGSVAFVNDSTLTGWSLFRAAGTALTVTSGTGSSNAGGFYSFGNSADRALGSLASGATGTVNYALSLTNTSGSALSAFTLSYDGEQWRNGGAATVQSLTFEYGFGSSYATVAWQAPGAGFDFASPVNTATAGIVDGNVAGLVSGLGGTVNTSWAAGQTLWLRWTDIDNTGADSGLAIDNVSLSVSAVPEPSTYAMLLAGVAAVGFIARRRRSA